MYDYSRLKSIQGRLSNEFAYQMHTKIQTVLKTIMTPGRSSDFANVISTRFLWVILDLFYALLKLETSFLQKHITATNSF